jgi:hypothetical protein
VLRYSILTNGNADKKRDLYDSAAVGGLIFSPLADALGYQATGSITAIHAVTQSQR